MQRLTVSLFLFVIILLMSHRQPLLHELLRRLESMRMPIGLLGGAALSPEDLTHLAKQPDG